MVFIGSCRNVYARAEMHVSYIYHFSGLKESSLFFGLFLDGQLFIVVEK